MLQILFTTNKSGNGQTIYKVLNMKMISISIHHHTTTDGQHGFATIPLKYPLLAQSAARCPVSPLWTAQTTDFLNWAK